MKLETLRFLRQLVSEERSRRIRALGKAQRRKDNAAELHSISASGDNPDRTAFYAEVRDKADAGLRAAKNAMVSVDAALADLDGHDWH